MTQFWGSRDAQAARQAATGRVDAGTRGAVTGGGHLDAVGELIIETARTHLPSDVTVHTGGGNRNPLTAIAGYVRPTKQWDIVFRRVGAPIAIIELKSQVGSFGNNANNRAEEAVGNAADVLSAQKHGLLPRDLWRGYVFVIEDCPASRGPSTLGDDPRWAMDPAFRNASYLTRVTMLCDRLVTDGYYDAAWAVATRQPPDFAWSEPDARLTGYDRFATKLQEFFRSL